MFLIKQKKNEKIELLVIVKKSEIQIDHEILKSINSANWAELFPHWEDF